MRAQSILNRRAQTTGSTHNFKEIVQMCAKNIAHIKKTRRFRRELTIFNELLTAREGDESTKYSQSLSADDRLHARFKNKSRKCVKNALKKHTRNGVFFSGAADDKERRGDCLQEETPSAGDERSARL